MNRLGITACQRFQRNSGAGTAAGECNADALFAKIENKCGILVGRFVYFKRFQGQA
jgi:hypothetical protein